MNRTDRCRCYHKDGDGDFNQGRKLGPVLDSLWNRYIFSYSYISNINTEAGQSVKFLQYVLTMSGGKKDLVTNRLAEVIFSLPLALNF